MQWKMKGIALPFCLLLASGAAQAQAVKLGEVLDKAKEPMSKEAVSALLTDSVYTGTTPSGITFQINLKADGTLAGTGTNARGSGPVVGTWMVNDKGQYCSKQTLTALGQTFENCLFVFKAGEEYYTSLSDSDRGANAFKRGFKK